MNWKKHLLTLAAFAAFVPFAAAQSDSSPKPIPTPSEQEVRFFSHRGGRLEYDENTLSAFEASYQQGYRGYETDVRMTADGKLVILHDSNLKRTTDGEGVVEKMTEAEIRKFNTKGGHKVLFLDELLNWIDSKGDINYVEFELKTKPLELYPAERLHEYVDKLYKKVMKKKPAGATYLFTSSDYRGLRYLQEKYPDAELLLITSKPCCDETIALCRSVGIKRLGATIEGTTRGDVKKAHQKGLVVSLWPGKSAADAVLGIYLGADYLCTDVPVAVKTFISEKMPWVKASY